MSFDAIHVLIWSRSRYNDNSDIYSVKTANYNSKFPLIFPFKSPVIF